MSALTPRPGIMDITPYKGGESKVPGVDKIIKLASNEGPFGPSPKAVKAMKLAAESQHRYPDGAAVALRHKIGEVWGVDPNRVICGAGSDELLGLLCRAYAGPGDEVLYSEHGFLMYPIAAKTVGATPVKAPEVNLTCSVDNLLAAVTDKTRIVFIANPNNPTGTYLNEAELDRLHAGLPKDVLLVIDAAYAEFMTESDYDAGTRLVNRTDNVVMTRTFSKIYALGGIRLGWAYGPAEIIDVLNRARNPFNVSGFALAVGEAALEDTAFITMTREHNAKWLRWTEGECQDMGLKTTKSFANFALVQFPSEGPKTAAAADAYLRSKGIIVRAMTSYGLPNSLRISIGTEDEMRSCIQALRAFMKQ